MKSNLMNARSATFTLAFLMFGATPSWAGTVVLAGATGNSCSSYSGFSVDASGNLTVKCDTIATPASAPAPVATPTFAEVPSCTLTASPATVTPGSTSTLIAKCTPAATAYIWTGPGIGGLSTTASSGTVRPSDTTQYSVTGINSAGTGNSNTTVVTVKAASVHSDQGQSQSPRIAEIRAWNYAFEARNNIPHNYKLEPVAYMEYLKLIQSNKPTVIHLPTSW